MNFPKPFPTGLRGALTWRRSLSPVQMSVGMPGTRLFTRSYTKTFSSQLAKQNSREPRRGCVRQMLGHVPKRSPCGRAAWVPLFSPLRITLQSLCKWCTVRGRAGGEGAVPGWGKTVFPTPFPQVKSQVCVVQGILRQFSCQPRKRHFLHRICVASASDLTRSLLQRDARAGTEGCSGWDGSLQLAQRLCCGNGTSCPFSSFPRVGQRVSALLTCGWRPAWLT